MPAQLILTFKSIYLLIYCALWGEVGVWGGEHMCRVAHLEIGGQLAKA